MKLLQQRGHGTSEMNTTNYTKHEYSSKSNAIYLVRLEESPLP